MNGEKQIAPLNFAEYFRKSDASNNRKVCYGQLSMKWTP